MKVTFSEAADMILSRHSEFRDKLLAVLGDPLPGHCFIDGRVGRTPSNDEIVLRCQDRPTIHIPYSEFADAYTLKHITEKWSSPGPN